MTTSGWGEAGYRLGASELAPLLALVSAVILRLWLPGLELWLSAAIAVLSLLAFFTRIRSLRIAAAALLLSALVDVATQSVVRFDREHYDARSKEELALEFRHAGARISTLHESLAAAARRINAALTRTNHDDRVKLFRLAANEAQRPRRGARVRDAAGNVVAWWGEGLPDTAPGAFRFDVSNLYVVHTEQGKDGWSVETFERIPNTPHSDAALRTRAAADWIAASRFHAGVMTPFPGSVRAVVARDEGSTLFLDLRPRPLDEVLDSVRRRGRTASAMLLAIGFLCAATSALRRKESPHGREGAGWIILARTALLGIGIGAEPNAVFGFEVYASRALGPFTRSPFDLLATAAMLFAVAIVLSRKRSTVFRWWIAAPLLGAAIFGFTLFLENLAANCRISPIP
jgi:hypothetical protein